MRKTASMIGLVFILSFSVSTLMVPLTNATDEDTWTSMASQPIEMSWNTLGAAVVNGAIYVFGEKVYYTGGATIEFLIYQYDPNTNTWEAKTPPPHLEISYAMAIYKNKIYKIGGWVSVHVEVYDPSDDTWDTTGVYLQTRISAEANVVDDKIYVMGGGIWEGFHSPIVVSALNLVYDPRTHARVYNPTKEDYWTKMTPIPTPVMDYASAVVNGKIYIIGGFNRDGVSDLVQIFDPKTDQWSQGTPIPTGVNYAGSCATTGYAAPQKIYVIGGLVQTSNGNQGTNLTQINDPESDSWSIGASLPPTLDPHVTLVNINDILYAFDGSATEKYVPMGYKEPPPSNPEFPSWIILPLIIVTSVMFVVVVALYKRSLRNIQSVGR